MAPSRPDFQDLKRRVSLEQLLDQRGLLHTFSVSPNKLVGPCPLHRGDSRNAFVVSRARNLWYCFTACRARGDVIELVRRLDHVGYAEAGRVLARLAGPVILAPPTQPAAFRPFTRTLNLDPNIPFLREKAIRPATAASFQCGLYRGTGSLERCVAVRLHDPQGHPLGYAGRTLDPLRAQRTGKWRLPAALPKRSILFNYHRIAHQLTGGLAVVEDPWSVMRFAQLQLPAVAILGTTISTEQCALLVRAPAILLMLDGDPAGRQATRVVREQLVTAGLRVVTADLPDNTDPDQLADSQLQAAWDCFSALHQKP